MSRYAPRTTTPGGRRPARRVAVLALVLAGLVGGGPALADPATPPSDNDVRDARAAVTAAAGSVAAMEVRLAELAAAADAATVQVAQAGESYAAALAAAQSAHDAADLAAQRSSDAATTAEQARRTLVAMARQMARTGGSSDLLEAVLSADGLQDVAHRTIALEHATGQADEAVQEYRAAQLVATTLDERAQRSADEAETASTAAQGALTAAQEVQASAQATRDSAEAERQQLISRLAEARQTSAEVEAARQAQIEADRQARAEAAARASRLNPPAGTPTPPAPAGTPASAPAASAGTPVAPPAQTPATPPASSGVPAGTPAAPPAGGTGSSGSPSGGSSSGGSTAPTGGSSRGSAAAGQLAVDTARTRVGLPYLWGGTGPVGYDCSGLTMTSWSAAGVSLPRTSRDQYTRVQKIPYDQLRPGDLVFWADDPGDPSSIYHVAMWVGGNQIVEAPAPGKTVRVTTMRWSGTMPYAGRV